MEDIRWRVIGASVQGASHRAKPISISCQDAHNYRLLPDGTVLIAIADGAGSASRSAEGASLAVGRALDALEAGLADRTPSDEAGWRHLLYTVFARTRQALIRWAKAEGLTPRDFATTLTCALITKGQLVVSQVGDGIVEDKIRQGWFPYNHPGGYPIAPPPRVI